MDLPSIHPFTVITVVMRHTQSLTLLSEVYTKSGYERHWRAVHDHLAEQADTVVAVHLMTSIRLTSASTDLTLRYTAFALSAIMSNRYTA